MRFHCHPIILADHSSHIASLPRRSGLLRKIMSRLLRTFSTRLRGESWRPTMKWVNYRSDYPRFVAKNANGENGSIYLRASQVSYFTPLSLTMMNGLSAGYRYAGSPSHLVTTYVTDSYNLDAARRIACPFRISHQLALVQPDVDHTIFK